MDNLTLWQISWAIGAVVVLIVAALLLVIIAAARSIDKRAAEIWTVGKQIAANTVSIWMLQKTNAVAGEILATAKQIAAGAGDRRQAFLTRRKEVMPAVLVATLAYLAILVAVLAVGLILIAWRLTATAKAIRQIRDALAQVQTNTAPLGDALVQVNAALAQLSAGLSSVLEWLVLADGSLGRIVKRFRSSAA